MPKISDEKRAERRLEILEAAWRCFHRQGLHLATMDDIIRECGLSAGAVYGYFKNKDELIVKAIGTSMSELSGRLALLLENGAFEHPANLIEETLRAVDRFSARDGYDLRRIALLGWAEAQRSEAVLTALRGHYAGFLVRLEAVVRGWQGTGTVDDAADPKCVAKTLLSVIMGYVAQSAILGDVTAETIGGGLKGLATGGTNNRVRNPR